MAEEDSGDQFRRLAEMIEALARPKAAKPARYDSELIELAVKRLSEIYALVLMGGKLRVLHETRDFAGKPELEFIGLDDFRVIEGTERYYAGKSQPVGIGQLYLYHQARRFYRGLCFAPEGAPADFLNLWRGFAYEASAEPLEKACPLFLDHMTVNIAGCQADRLAYVWAWFAHMVQKPTERPGVALVLRGKEGTGKTKVGEVMGALLGRHYFLVDDSRYLVGQFNAHMAHCLLLQCDEGFWAGDKPAEGRLKGLITSAVQMVEHKGLDAIPMRNLVRLLVTSNESWVVPAGAQARRYAVLDVAEAARANAEYFAAIDAEMAAGGYRALLGFLQRFDLGAVNLRLIPETGALRDQKIATMSPEQSWWLECLRRGAPLKGHETWGDDLNEGKPPPVPAVSCDQLYSDYIAYCERLGVRRRAGPDQLRTLLRPYLPDEFERVRRRRPVQTTDSAGVITWSTRRVYLYVLPELALARSYFAGEFGLPADYFDLAPGADEEDPPAVP